MCPTDFFLPSSPPPRGTWKSLPPFGPFSTFFSGYEGIGKEEDGGRKKTFARRVPKVGAKKREREREEQLFLSLSPSSQCDQKV